MIENCIPSHYTCMAPRPGMDEDEDAMKQTSSHTPFVQSSAGFADLWGGTRNFLIDPALFLQCVPSLPPLAEVVAQARQDPRARITCNTDARSMNLASAREWFCQLPIEEAMAQRFNLAHFDLTQLMEPGAPLAELRERVLEPWQAFLREAGFTWERMYPILFISGRSSLTPYHMDLSHVLAWQVYGQKDFSALADPERYAPQAMRERFVRNRANYPEWFHMPEGLAPQEVVTVRMKPGALLWNVFLTPHWVASVHDEPAMSINISHGGLRLHGRLCAFEQEARQWDSTLTDYLTPRA